MGPKEQVLRCAWWLGPGQKTTVVFPSICCSAYKSVDETTDMGMRRQELMYCVILFILFKKITAEPGPVLFRLLW